MAGFVCEDTNDGGGESIVRTQTMAAGIGGMLLNCYLDSVVSG